MLRSDLHNFSEAYIVVKGTITVTGTSNRSKKRRFWHLNIMHQLLVAFQKLMIHSLIMQRLRCCNTYIEFD